MLPHQSRMDICHSIGTWDWGSLHSPIRSMSYKLEFGFIPRFIETSGEINEFMKVHTLNLADKVEKPGLRMYGSTIAVMGLAYKKILMTPESISNRYNR